ncbi:MAG: 1-phosphofructokinase family hexose kinase [Desulfobacterales bacterium]|nr:1-phosphofructokinase family hexose kinase [Desulfobacterales bacterium]
MAPVQEITEIMKHIATITVNPAVDKSTQVQSVTSERKLRCDKPTYDAGGGGINVARAIFRLGGDAAAVYAVGGLPGEMLKKLLDEEGIRHHPFQVEDATRQNLTVYEKESGEQYRFGMPGPHLQPGEWSGFLDQVGQLDPRPDFLVASGSLPPGVPSDFYRKVAQLSRDLGARLIMDSSGEAFRTAVRKEGVFLIKPNLRELEALAGRPLENEEAQVNFAKELVGESSVEAVVISLGAAGAAFVHREGYQYFRAPTVKIRSKVGAGDSMVAGMVLAISRGSSLSDAVQFGIAAGAAAVMNPGNSLCCKEDVEKLYDEMGS